MFPHTNPLTLRSRIAANYSKDLEPHLKHFETISLGYCPCWNSVTNIALVSSFETFHTQIIPNPGCDSWRLRVNTIKIWLPVVDGCPTSQGGYHWLPGVGWIPMNRIHRINMKHDWVHQFDEDTLKTSTQEIGIWELALICTAVPWCSWRQSFALLENHAGWDVPHDMSSEADWFHTH